MPSAPGRSTSIPIPISIPEKGEEEEGKGNPRLRRLLSGRAGSKQNGSEPPFSV